MPFDPLSWAFGQALSRGLDVATAKTLRSALHATAQDWASSLETEFQVHPEAIFRDPRIASTDERPALMAVQEILSEQRIPHRHQWVAALLEQWKAVRNRKGAELQPFFLRSEEEVVPHLEKLAGRLHDDCASQQGLFHASVIEILEELKVQALARPRAFPDPVERTRGTQFLHQQIEEVADCRIDLVVVESNIVHLWGNRFGKTARDARRKLIIAAVLAAMFGEKVYVGLADTTDLPGSDGQGHVGFLRIGFTQAELLGFVAADAIPSGYWDNKVAELPGGDNSPFQNWVEKSWREVEEWR